MDRTESTAAGDLRRSVGLRGDLGRIPPLTMIRSTVSIRWAAGSRGRGLCSVRRADESQTHFAANTLGCQPLRRRSPAKSWLEWRRRVAVSRPGGCECRDGRVLDSSDELVNLNRKGGGKGERLKSQRLNSEPSDRGQPEQGVVVVNSSGR